MLMQTLQSLFTKHWIFAVNVYSRFTLRYAFPCLVIYWNLWSLLET